MRRSNDRYNIEERKVPDLVGKIKTFPVFLLFGSFSAGQLVSTILVFLLKITVQRFSISSQFSSAVYFGELSCWSFRGFNEVLVQTRHTLT